MSDFSRFAIVMTTAALAVGMSAYMAIAKTDVAQSGRLRYGAVWGAVAMVTAWLNMYFAVHPFVEGQHGVWTQLLVTFSAAGLVGGLASSLTLPSVSMTHVSVATLRWTIALAVGGLLTPYAVYFGVAGADLTERLRLGADGGGALGMFATGFLVGYLVAWIGSLPAASVDSADFAAQQLEV